MDDETNRSDETKQTLALFARYAMHDDYKAPEQLPEKPRPYMAKEAISWLHRAEANRTAREWESLRADLAQMTQRASTLGDTLAESEQLRLRTTEALGAMTQRAETAETAVSGFAPTLEHAARTRDDALSSLSLSRSTANTLGATLDLRADLLAAMTTDRDRLQRDLSTTTTALVDERDLTARLRAALEEAEGVAKAFQQVARERAQMLKQSSR